MDQLSPEVLASIFGTVLPRRSAVYIASPITGGRRFFEWRRRHPNCIPTSADESFREEVISANREASAAGAAQVRRHLDQPAIDPSQMLDIDGWSQPDYRTFWRHVIVQFCDSVVLLTGWELSIGCVSEFAVAAHLGLRILNSELEPVSAKSGFQQIHKAIAEIEAEGFSADEIRPQLDNAIATAGEFPLAIVDSRG